MRTALGTFEFVIMSLISANPEEESYGQNLSRQVDNVYERRTSDGAVATTLYRLEKSGFVKSKFDLPRPVRGGKARRCYKLTRVGRDKLMETAAILNVALNLINNDPQEKTNAA